MSERENRPVPDVIDPDLDVDADVDRRHRGLLTLAVIAAGGVLGAEARYGLSVALPHGDAAWAWATLLTNVIGSFLIGILMITVERRASHHLVRPFVGVGMLGGFTTFSTFALDAQHLLNAGRPFVALGYAAASLVGCFVTTAFAVTLARRTVTAGTGSA